MCLAIPARVVSVAEHRIAEVDTYGVTRTVSLDLVPEADAGSWVLVHAGYAIQVVDEQFAAESWELINQMADAIEMGGSPAPAEEAGTMASPDLGPTTGTTGG